MRLKTQDQLHFLTMPKLEEYESFFYPTSKSTQPYQRGCTSITGFRLKLREIM